ncbi:hypothetical protein SHJG_0420 [Streptomyces hygroscopicus subsp. jinggangensis 5008]|nr:hypothetical protein SHJG_0420 [Streptomyces hygroscopicus subsp. jinggangensis 5008]AGF59920.1 hypothetical protein SHJGH_0254 [Streptomyces hygroscopicus subsp. jinggangensis TL01]
MGSRVTVDSSTVRRGSESRTRVRRGPPARTLLDRRPDADGLTGA